MTQVGCSDTEISVNFFLSRAYCIPVADCCFTDSSLAIAAACSLQPNTSQRFMHQTTQCLIINFLQSQIQKKLSRCHSNDRIRQLAWTGLIWPIRSTSLLVLVWSDTCIPGRWHTFGCGRPPTSAPLIYRQIVRCSTDTQHIWRQFFCCRSTCLEQPASTLTQWRDFVQQFQARTKDVLISWWSGRNVTDFFA